MFPFFLRVFFSRFVYFKSLAFGVLCQNLPNGPEIGPAFSSIFMFIVIFVLFKTWHLPHVYIMVVSFGTSFPLGFMLNTLKNVTFFGWFCVSPQRQRFFSITSTCGPSLQ